MDSLDIYLRLLNEGLPQDHADLLARKISDLNGFEKLPVID